MGILSACVQVSGEHPPIILCLEQTCAYLSPDLDCKCTMILGTMHLYAVQSSIPNLSPKIGQQPGYES